MNKSKLAFCKAVTLLLCLFAGFSSHAQNTNDHSGLHKYYYVFEGALNADQKTELDMEISKLPDVSFSKTEYKEATAKGQLRVFVKPHVRVSEKDKLFDTEDLKKILVRYNLTPVELKEIKD